MAKPASRHLGLLVDSAKLDLNQSESVLAVKWVTELAGGHHAPARFGLESSICSDDFHGRNDFQNATLEEWSNNAGMWIKTPVASDFQQMLEVMVKGS